MVMRGESGGVLPVVYTVEHHEHGILVRGEPVPMDVLGHLGAMAETEGYDLMDPGISGSMGATFAFVNAESGAAWREEIANGLTHLGPLDAWIRGTDVGISAQTIAHVLSGGRVPPSSFGAGVPHDAGDFGRCLRLVRLMGWTERLPEVGERYPMWTHVVERWAAMVLLYDAEAWEELYRCLKA